jgi:hypothetical protein
MTLPRQDRQHIVFIGNLKDLSITKEVSLTSLLDLGTLIVGLPVFEIFKVGLINIELLVFEPPTLSSQLFLRNRTDTILRFNALS